MQYIIFYAFISAISYMIIFQHAIWIIAIVADPNFK